MGHNENAAVLLAAELQKASMVTFLGYTFNVYATILIVLFVVFLIAIYRAHRVHRFDWMDMITRDGTKLSATKILQLVGGIVGTWIVIKLTLQGQLDWDIFGIYLTYVASIDGFSKFMFARYGAAASDESAVGTRQYNSRHYNTYDSYYGSDGYGKKPVKGQRPPKSTMHGETAERDSPEDFADGDPEEIQMQGGAKTPE